MNVSCGGFKTLRSFYFSLSSKKRNGNIIGVIAQTLIQMKRQSALPTELIVVDSMSERKAKMKLLADIFVVLPGSYGTLDEMFDIVASGVVGEHKKPLILVNQNGFFDDFINQISRMRTEFFIPAEEKYKPLVVENIDCCIDLINLSFKH